MRRFVWLLLLIVFVAFIFYNSSMPAAESHRASELVGSILTGMGKWFGIDVPQQNLDYNIRKLAHFLEFAILGVILFHAAGWGFVALYAWQARYAASVTPGFDPTGSAAYFALRPSHLLSARPRPHHSLQKLSQAQVQNAGLSFPQGRPLPHAPDAHAGGEPDRPHHCAGAAPERGPHRGHRPRA